MHVTGSSVLQGDIFSLGIIMYELFTMCPLAASPCLRSMHGDYRVRCERAGGAPRTFGQVVATGPP